MPKLSYAQVELHHVELGPRWATFYNRVELDPYWAMPVLSYTRVELCPCWSMYVLSYARVELCPCWATQELSYAKHWNQKKRNEHLKYFWKWVSFISFYTAIIWKKYDVWTGISFVLIGRFHFELTWQLPSPNNYILQKTHQFHLKGFGRDTEHLEERLFKINSSENCQFPLLLRRKPHNGCNHT